MTDTQTMRAEFEAWAISEELSIRRSTVDDEDYYDYASSQTWSAFQAAWTRKPAAQVAGAARFYMSHDIWHDRETGQHVFTQAQYDEKWQASYVAGARDFFFGTTQEWALPLMRLPAPEPDATKVVSVPVPWETTANKLLPHTILDMGMMRVERQLELAKAELAEWRALAADRERT